MSVSQVYSISVLLLSVLVYLWLEHYVSVEQDLSYALPIFLFSVSVATFSLSLLACCCIIKTSSPAPVGYLVSFYRKLMQNIKSACCYIFTEMSHSLFTAFS